MDLFEWYRCKGHCSGGTRCYFRSLPIRGRGQRCCKRRGGGPARLPIFLMMMIHVRAHIARHAPMTHGIHAVGCKSYFDDGIGVGRKKSAALIPTVVSAGSTNMPACESPSPISSSAQIIPWLSSPRILALFMVSGSPWEG